MNTIATNTADIKPRILMGGHLYYGSTDGTYFTPGYLTKWEFLKLIAEQHPDYENVIDDDDAIEFALPALSDLVLNQDEVVIDHVAPMDDEDSGNMALVIRPAEEDETGAFGATVPWSDQQ